MRAALFAALLALGGCGGSDGPGGSLHAALSNFAGANTANAPFDAVSVLGEVRSDGTFSFSGEDSASSVIAQNRGRQLSLTIHEAVGAMPVAGRSYAIAAMAGKASLTLVQRDSAGERDWFGAAGTATLTDVAGDRVSVSFAGATMQPLTSSATGSFQLDGQCAVDKVLRR